MPHDIVASEDKTVYVGDAHARTVWKFVSSESMFLLFICCLKDPSHNHILSESILWLFFFRFHFHILLLLCKQHAAKNWLVFVSAKLTVVDMLMVLSDYLNLCILSFSYKTSDLYCCIACVHLTECISILQCVVCQKSCFP